MSHFFINQQVLAAVLHKYEREKTLDLGALATQRHVLAVHAFLIDEYRTMSFGEEVYLLL